MSNTPARSDRSAFEDQLTAAFLELRRALEAALRAARLDPAEPQEVARRLGINRNLTWKIAKVVGTSDPYHALQHLPGHAALATFASALRRAGGSSPLIDHITTARAALDHVVATHTSDRATLELILGSMVGGGSGEGMAQSLKLAFRGNSGVWGIQARTHASAVWIAPSREQPTRLDRASVGMLVDVRTLRPGARCPLYAPRHTHDDTSIIPPTAHPIEPAHDDHTPHATSRNNPGERGPMLLREFCSPNMPSVSPLEETQGAPLFEIDGGPLGNTGAFTCVFGWMEPNSTPRYRSEDDHTAELAMQILLPVENALLDLFLHKDIHLDQLPDSACRPLSTGPRAEFHHRIPLAQRPTPIEGQPPAIDTPLIPDYSAIADRVASRLRWSLGDFRPIRLHVPFAPMHTEMVLRFPLDLEPASSPA